MKTCRRCPDRLYAGHRPAQTCESHDRASPRVATRIGMIDQRPAKARPQQPESHERSTRHKRVWAAERCNVVLIRHVRFVLFRHVRQQRHGPGRLINRVWAAELCKFVLFRHVRQQRHDPGRLINRVWAAELCKFALFRHVRQHRHDPGRLSNRVWAAEL